MKFIIVISEVTYVNNNYRDLIHETIKRFPKDVVGIIIIKNLSLKIIGQIAWLYQSRCYNTANALLKNINPYKEYKQWKKIKNKIPILKVKNINDSNVIDWIDNLNVDVIINARTRSLFHKQLIEIPHIGCINIHHGLLPEYRGVFCDLYALYNYEDAGFSIHEMTEKIDDGPILHTQIVCKKRQFSNYQKYLTYSTQQEIIALENILQKIKLTNKLTTNKKLISDQLKPIYHTTPDKKTLTAMIKSGLKL